MVHFFVGNEADIPSEPSQFTRSPHHVGSVHTFSTDYWTRGNNNGVTCENCTTQQDNHVLSKGQLPATLELLGRAASSQERWSSINHLGPDHIEEYLEKNLHWRIVAVCKLSPLTRPPVTLQTSYFYSKLTYNICCLQQVPGELIDTEQLPDLKVIVLAGKAEHPDDPSQLSRFTEYQPLYRATRGKVGGATAEDGLIRSG